MKIKNSKPFVSVVKGNSELSSEYNVQGLEWEVGISIKREA